MLLILSKTESVGELQHNSWGGAIVLASPTQILGDVSPAPSSFTPMNVTS